MTVQKDENGEVIPKMSKQEAKASVKEMEKMVEWLDALCNCGSGLTNGECKCCVKI